MDRTILSRNKVGSNNTLQQKHVVEGVDNRLSSPDNVYSNILLSNDETNKAQIAQFNVTRSESYLPKANDYYMAVARFEIPNNNIPLFIFKEQTYGICMVNGAASSTVYCTLNPAPGNLNRAIYNVQTFLDTVNIAIETACTAVGIADIPRVYLELPSQLQKIRFSSNANWLGSGTTPVWQLWMNWELFYFFQTMQVYFTGSYIGQLLAPPPPPGNNLYDAKGYKIVVKDNYNGNYVAGTSYTMSQETPLLALYISILNLIVATSSLPINGELISVRQGSTSATFNTIADFAPGQVANYSDNFTPYIYNPAFYRLIDLNSASPLNKLDFTIYYSDADNNISPLYLLPSQKLTVKLVFVKKALYNNEYS